MPIPIVCFSDLVVFTRPFVDAGIGGSTCCLGLFGVVWGRPTYLQLFLKKLKAVRVGDRARGIYP